MHVDLAMAKLAGKSNFKIERTSGGNMDGLTAHEISAACAGLRRDCYLLALALYVQDYSGLNELTGGVIGYTHRIARQNNWRIPKDSQIVQNMALLSIDEIVFAHEHKCKFCTNGFIYLNNGDVDPCKHCKGNPHGHMSIRDRADNIGVNESNMRRNWSAKYEVIHRHVLNMRNKAWDHIAKGLKTPQDGL